MVKNAGGGNKSKKLGRKHVIESSVVKPLRVAQNEGEMYVCVIKIYGNGRFGVKNVSGMEYMCHMGNKFRGRFKRDNMVVLGSWLLVGKREWETDPVPPKKPNCDVLEVYNSMEMDMLKSRVMNINWNYFHFLVENNVVVNGGGGGKMQQEKAEMSEEMTMDVYFTDDIGGEEEEGGEKMVVVTKKNVMIPAAAVAVAAAVSNEMRMEINIDDI
jgi:translation initiation factor IF-1